jgi:hypothetical protein
MFYGQSDTMDIELMATDSAMKAFGARRLQDELALFAFRERRNRQFRLSVIRSENKADPRRSQPA